MTAPASLGKKSTADLIAELAAISQDESQRAKAIALSKKITASLEDPLARSIECIYKPLSTISVRMAVALNLFEHICSAEGSISSAELAWLSGGEERLITRILRTVASIDFVEQVGPYEWQANGTTKAMSLPSVAAGHRCDVLVRAAMTGPKFLEETHWKSPSDPDDAFLQFSEQTKLPFYQYMSSQPTLFADFNLFMGALKGSQGSWCDWYDIKGRVLDGYDHDRGHALLVDVGGGRGHDLQIFHKHVGGTFGKALFLQDRLEVLQTIPDAALDPRITKMQHDFLRPQPVKGARVYFLHHILHNWSDKICLEILEQIYAAMTPGYSKLVINEIILPDMGVTEIQMGFDMTMMTINSGVERTSLEFTQLLQKVGFKVTHIQGWPDKDGIVEAEVAV